MYMYVCMYVYNKYCIPMFWLPHVTFCLVSPRFNEKSCFQAMDQSFLGALIHSLCRAWQWRLAWELMEMEVPKWLA